MFIEEKGNKFQPTEEFVRCLYITSKGILKFKESYHFLCENNEDNHLLLLSDAREY